MALKLLNDQDLFGQANSYIEPPEARRGLAPAVTAVQATGDLRRSTRAKRSAQAGFAAAPAALMRRCPIQGVRTCLPMHD